MDSGIQAVVKVRGQQGNAIPSGVTSNSGPPAKFSKWPPTATNS